MKRTLKTTLQIALDDWLNEQAVKPQWDGYVHNELIQQMANAAEQVFDATMSVQVWLKHEGHLK